MRPVCSLSTNHFKHISSCLFFNICANGWYMLSGRISESVPVRRTRNCDARIRSWRTTEPRPAICTLLYCVFYSIEKLNSISSIILSLPRSLITLTSLTELFTSGNRSLNNKSMFSWKKYSCLLRFCSFLYSVFPL